MLQLSGVVSWVLSYPAGEMLGDKEQQVGKCYSYQVQVDSCSSCPAGGILGDQEQQRDQFYCSQVSY